jgi:hypothetical protein
MKNVVSLARKQHNSDLSMKKKSLEGGGLLA